VGPRGSRSFKKEQHLSALQQFESPHRQACSLVTIDPSLILLHCIETTLCNASIDMFSNSIFMRKSTAQSELQARHSSY
jgi:hypothetical protein